MDRFQTDRLAELAGTDENRLAVLKARRGREIQKTRRLTCLTCNGDEWTNRDKGDPCFHCLSQMWAAQDVLSGHDKKAVDNGMIAYRMTGVYHWLPNPGLQYDIKVPDNAVFARGDRGGANDVFQRLYVELVTELAKMAPSDAEGRRNAKVFIRANTAYSGVKIYFRATEGFTKALEAIWHFVRWNDEAASQVGFNEGRNMLSAMNLGQKTFEQFSADVAGQLERSQRRMKDTAEGKNPTG